MNENQDIQSHKIKHSLNYIHLTYLFKLIKDKFTS